jgi:sarcosine oxidase
MTDVFVVGAGVMGAATARELARRGREVVLFERFEIGHTKGSSHGASRIFRLSYDDPMYVRMAQEALVLWRELEDEVGDPILTTTGGVDVGEPALANDAALEACGATHERMTGVEAAERFPVFTFGHEETVVYQPDAGIVHAERSVRAFVDSAVRHGAELHEHACVESVRPDGDGVAITVAGDELRGGAAVVTAGAWARPVLSTAGIDLPVTTTRQTATYFGLEGPPPPVLVQWESYPLYALADPGRGIKAAQHQQGGPADPEEPGLVDEEQVARLARWVGERFPDVDAASRPADTCMYTNTADERFILERRGPVVIGSPCSGHGFKFAPLIGSRLADLATA